MFGGNCFDRTIVLIPKCHMYIRDSHDENGSVFAGNVVASMLRYSEFNASLKRQNGDTTGLYVMYTV